MRHRGTCPPETAYHHAFALGHVRLPIQGDVKQPIQDFYPNDQGGGHFGRAMLAYNGELFNYDTASYRSDARWLFERLKEVDDFQEHLSYDRILGNMDGFYSFAFINRKDELILATDYLAQKPVYYMLDETGERIISAASEIRGLIDEVKEHELDTYWISTVRKFRYYPMTDGRTWHRRIKTLFPGTMLVVQKDGSYHSQPLNPVRRDMCPWNIDKNFNRAALELRDLLTEAVRTRVELSDVPVSVLLSGGIDSSAIYKLAKSKCPRVNLNPFTFENGTDGEFVGLIDPNTRILKEPGSTKNLSKVLRINEGPVDLGSMLPQYHLGQAICEEGFVVAISGDGADELFGGYRRAMDYDSQDSDVWSELVSYHLPRLDKMMMWSTVELRSPFLAKPVVEFALGLPWEWRQGKNLLKEAMRGVVPDEIIDRPKEPLKIGSVRDNKEKHTLALMNQWLEQEDKI
jgi:asparagine synthetase B (glutamine-hydrolysing)